ncbi:hypothetical protein LZ554_004310 [Drepanopeziza brunnea f. sp. 'monogermtubi']|nr:hypothetical protein LZ554_004310 [Drepanopeziza brunnea f. sp. 'monogermtubi']
MRFINAFFAATTFAIAIAEEQAPPREGFLQICERPGFQICKNVTYYQDRCVDLEEFGLEKRMTGFDTFGYGCEFYGSDVCLTDLEYFVYRGAIVDLLETEYASNNDKISAFRCGT